MSFFESRLFLPLFTFVSTLRTLGREIRELDRTSYRPTVIIGLGGTGTRVVRILQFLLRFLFGKERAQIFQFLAIDTAFDAKQRIDAGDFLHLRQFDNITQARHLESNPFLHAWWPIRPDGEPFIPPAMTGDGTGRVRATGRHALFHYIGRVVTAIEEKVDKAIAINAQQGIGATSVKFYVIASGAGGTGSGLFTDICYLCRKIGLARQAAAFVTGVVVMHDVFLGLGRTEQTRADMKANALALLTEVNHFSQTRTFQVAYNNWINTHDLDQGVYRPVDVLYLIGKQNAGGKAIDSLESLSQMIAAEIALETASPLNNYTSNVLDNVSANERYVAGQPAAYSSFALSALVFPIGQIASWCSANLFGEFARHVILTPQRPASEATVDATAFLQRAEVDASAGEQLLTRLQRNGQDEVMTAPILILDQVAAAPEVQRPGMLQRLIEDNQAILAEQRVQVRRNVEPIGRRFAADLHELAQSVCQDAARGPRYLGWQADALVNAVHVQRRSVLDEQAVQREMADQSAAALSSALNDLALAVRLSGLHPLRGRRLNRAAADAVAAFNANAAATLALEAHVQAAKLLEQMLEQLRRVARQAHDLVSGWENLASLVEAQAGTRPARQQATQTQYSLFVNIVEDDALDDILAQYRPALDNAAQRDYLAGEFWRFFNERADGWHLMDDSALELENPLHPGLQLYHFLHRHFVTAMEDSDLLARLEAQAGSAWQREVEAAYQRTEPFWNVNMGIAGDELNANLQYEPSLVGYGGQDGAWVGRVQQAIGESVDCIDTNDPHQLLILRTAHGLPLFALRSMRALRDAYDVKLREWMLGWGNPIPLHVFPFGETRRTVHGVSELPPLRESEPAIGRPDLQLQPESDPKSDGVPHMVTGGRANGERSDGRVL